MLIKDMTAKECQEILTRIGFGRLACVKDSQPYVLPIYFAYEPDHVYGFSTFGRKIEWMRLNPRVCLEVDEVTSHISWTSIIIDGRYEELPGTPECRSERDQAQRLLEKRFLWWQTAYAAEQLRSRNKPSPTIFYRIHIGTLSGRRAIPDAVETAYSGRSKSRPLRRQN